DAGVRALSVGRQAAGARPGREVALGRAELQRRPPVPDRPGDRPDRVAARLPPDEVDRRGGVHPGRTGGAVDERGRPGDHPGRGGWAGGGGRRGGGFGGWRTGAGAFPRSPGGRLAVSTAPAATALVWELKPGE